MDTANPYQVHDSIVKLVIPGLIRCSGRLPNSHAMGHVRKLDNSNVGTLELRERRMHIHTHYIRALGNSPTATPRMLEATR
jgi:hypothetical protein